MLSGQQWQQEPFSYVSDNIYTALILEEAEKLYNKLATELINGIIAVAAACKRYKSC